MTSLNNDTNSNNNLGLFTNSSVNYFQQNQFLQSLFANEFTKSNMAALLNPFEMIIMEKYKQLKATITDSGLLIPNENLVTQYRGKCYWVECQYQNEIEDHFKKHLEDGHTLNAFTLTQMELCFEKIAQLSKSLMLEQNKLYNMVQHMDNILKSHIHPTQIVALHPSDSTIQSNTVSSNANMPNTTMPPSSVISGGVGSGGLNLSCPLTTTATSSSSSSLSSSCIPQSAQDQLALLIAAAAAKSKQVPQLLELLALDPTSFNYPQPTPASILENFFQQQHHQQQPYSFPIGALTSSSSQSTFPSPDSFMPSTIANDNTVTASSTIQTSMPLLSSNKTALSPSIGTNNKSSSDIGADVAISTIAKPIRTSNKTTYGRKSSINHLIPHSNRPEGLSDREYYRHYPVRPNASYVILIKMAIEESPRKELSLNEIYLWIQTEFAFFRDDKQKWKNAVRHNLSLHKCFQRKQGKLWVFNENEYNLKKSRKFQYNPSINAANSETGAFTETGDFDDDHQDNNDSEEYPIKKEMEFTDESYEDDEDEDEEEENVNEHKTELNESNNTTNQLDFSSNQSHHVSEWSAYLHKNSPYSTIAVVNGNTNNSTAPS